MTPDQLALALNHIASKIDASSNPSRELVLQDLRKILASISEPHPQHHEAGWAKNLGLILLGLGLGGAIEGIRDSESLEEVSAWAERFPSKAKSTIRDYIEDRTEITDNIDEGMKEERTFTEGDWNKMTDRFLQAAGIKDERAKVFQIIRAKKDIAQKAGISPEAAPRYQPDAQEIFEWICENMGIKAKFPKAGHLVVVHIPNRLDQMFDLNTLEFVPYVR